MLFPLTHFWVDRHCTGLLGLAREGAFNRIRRLAYSGRPFQFLHLIRLHFYSLILRVRRLNSLIFCLELIGLSGHLEEINEMSLEHLFHCRDFFRLNLERLKSSVECCI